MNLAKSVRSFWAGCWLAVGLLTLPFAVASLRAGQAEAPADEVARAKSLEQEVTQGALRIAQKDGSVVECPLKHTDVQAEISGFVSRVRVTQTFRNPANEKIEAVYVFPLPHEAAVDEMTMVIGERRITGLIKQREEARRTYAAAVAAGQTAALLEQERPNIFTQTVGNIEPGQEVRIAISYVDVLRYDAGSYEFAFPMVVGPRFIPGNSISSPPPVNQELQGKVAPPIPDTDRVPDASRISPPVLKPGVRSGHDISLSVTLDAGVPIQQLSVANHQAEIRRSGDRQATVRLNPADSLPNKDFVLRYDVTGSKPEMALLAHTAEHGDSRRLGNGYFLLMIQPREDDRLTKSPPREIVFLVDVSGSMSGQPTAKVIETMSNMLKLCRPQDTIQVVTFANQANKLFEKPVPVTDANLKTALGFTANLQGSGGTHMLTGVRMAIDEPIDPERLRIVVMLTDGYIGNEAEIIEHVGKHCGDQVRFWCVGIGASPNMFLVDGVARQGGGMGKQLGLTDDSANLSQEIMTRIQRAQLAKIQIDWNGLKVAETYPARIPELWAGRPVILLGRYAGGGAGKIVVRGSVEGEAVSWPLEVSLPEQRQEHDSLAKIWARWKIEDLMHQSFYHGSPAVEEEVTAMALDYKLMSQYTSFVAVDERDPKATQTTVRPPRQMLVPVPLPDGTRWEGFFGPLGGEEADHDRDGLSRLNEGTRVDRLAAGSFIGAGASAASAPNEGRQSLTIRHRNAPAATQPASAPRLYSLARRTEGEVKLRQAGGAGGRGPSPIGSDSYQRAGFSFGAIVESEAKSGRATLAKGINGRFAELNDQIAPAKAPLSLAEALVTPSEPLAKAAREWMERAKQARQANELDSARAGFERAFFLIWAASASTEDLESMADEALAALSSMRQQRVEGWIKQVPALERKLQLEIRDQSLAQALDAVSTAAGLNVRLVPGSLDDAISLVSAERTRIDYLDLRGATASQALDWILVPLRLTWQMDEKGAIAATSQRRLTGNSTWIYDVSLFVLPDDEALSKPAGREQALAAARKTSDEFLAAVRGELKPRDEFSLTWYGPGQLLVAGDQAFHAATGKLFADLANANAKVNDSLRSLQATTARIKARQQTTSQREVARHKWSIATKHETFGWQLLASAAANELDLEALTQLQIAWKDPATAELLAGNTALVPLRSAWALSEAASVLQPNSGPHHAELAALAVQARERARSAAMNALTDLEKNPDDVNAFARTLYASLLLREEQPFVAKALPVLTRQRSADSPLTSAAVLAGSLLGAKNDNASTSLATVIQSGVAGDDLVVLAALACHRVEGPAWATFRAAAKDLLGQQPLAGQVVVLISRLDGSRLGLGGKQ